MDSKSGDFKSGDDAPECLATSGLTTNGLAVYGIAIPGVDTAKGIAMTGGTIRSYRQVLSMFCKDSKERLQLLRFYLFGSMGEDKFPEKHLAAFTTHVHAIKSASASLGAVEMSAEANRLEEAGKAKELSFIWENLSGFIEHLTKLETDIRAVLELLAEKTGSAPDSGEGGVLLDIFLLNELIEALKSQNVETIERILGELNQKVMDQNAQKSMEQISDQILMTEFDSAVKTIEKLISQNS